MTADASLAPGDPGSAAGEPRWLDAEEQQAWRAWLYSAQLLQDRLDRELTHATGISHAYYEILVALSETEGRMMRMSELADRCLSSRSRLSHAVSRLEERGWVRRQVCAEDAEVDALKEQIFRELLTFMMEDARTIPRAIRLILISRFLERVADHATNIAEMVVYLVEGKMVRHTLA